MRDIEIKDLRKTFTRPNKGEHLVLNDVTLDIRGGSFTTLIGVSGCGKSTLLNIMAGIEQEDAGEFRLDGEKREFGDFSFGYVFQEPRLLDWKTVEENIRFAAESRGKKIDDEEMSSILDLVDLKGEKKTYPIRLSGGMRQRVGIARALAVDPDTLLMDEPFSDLDEITARRLRQELIKIWQETGRTIFFVTHDLSEAIFLSEHVYFMEKETGKISYEFDVELPYPRDYEDVNLLEIKKDLMDKFLQLNES